MRKKGILLGAGIAIIGVAMLVWWVATSVVLVVEARCPDVRDIVEELMFQQGNAGVVHCRTAVWEAKSSVNGMTVVDM